MGHTSHHPTYADRGRAFSHRWDVACSCGSWRSIPTRTRKEARSRFGEHVAAVTNETSRRRQSSGPRTPTARVDLPEVLR